MSGQRKNRIRQIPTRKAAVPFSFWRRAKKARVFWRPIIRVRPITKRIWGLLVGWGKGGMGKKGGVYVSHCEPGRC